MTPHPQGRFRERAIEAREEKEGTHHRGRGTRKGFTHQLSPLTRFVSPPRRAGGMVIAKCRVHPEPYHGRWWYKKGALATVKEELKFCPSEEREDKRNHLYTRHSEHLIPDQTCRM